jgi:Mn-containing catalase
MPQLKELLVEELQDLLHAETQLTAALPKMAEAASHPTLKEAFEKHLQQTQKQVQRLEKVFEALGEKAEPKPCRAMMGLIEEGKERMQETAGKEAPAADLALNAAAQKIEHYEIAAYGTVRGLARQLGEFDCARLLSHTLGEEESADFLLTSISDPLVQQAALNERGANVNLDLQEKQPSSKKKSARTEKVAG